MLATPVRDLPRCRRGGLPAGMELADPRVAIPIDGGRVARADDREEVARGGPARARKSRSAWREPKVVILYEWDVHGRRVRGGVGGEFREFGEAVLPPAGAELRQLS